MPKRLPWKGGFRKVPEWLLAKVKHQKGDFIVACVKKVPLADIGKGLYRHVGVTAKDDEPVFAARVLPGRTTGRFSAINLDGLVVVRRDLPMVTKTYSWETPNWGDWSKGSHTTDLDRKVYDREFDPPRELSLSVDLVAREGTATEPLFVFRFAVEEVLRKGERGLPKELLFAINLLQENVGRVDVFPASATREDYLKTVYVHWEILPPGERDATVAYIVSRMKGSGDEVRARLEDRFDLLAKLKPTAYISGTSGFRRYFGAKFADDLVVFENLEYGNAIYVMGDSWETLSKMSRIDLLRSRTEGFVRIVHRSGWKDELRRVVRQLRKRPATAGV